MIYTAIPSLSLKPRKLKIKREQLGYNYFIFKCFNFQELKSIYPRRIQQNLGNRLPKIFLF